MSGERLSMRKIREVLRLRLDQGLPQRAVAQSLGLSQGAVHGYVARARRAGLSWPLPEGLDDSQLRCAAVSAATRCGDRPATGSGLGGGAPRVAAAKYDPGAALGGVPGRAVPVWPGLARGFRRSTASRSRPSRRRGIRNRAAGDRRPARLPCWRRKRRWPRAE